MPLSRIADKETSMTSRTVEIDIRGQVCPSTLLLTLREINRYQKDIQAGTVELIILTDNRNACVTVPQAVQNMGLQAQVDKSAGSYAIRIHGGEELA